MAESIARSSRDAPPTKLLRVGVGRDDLGWHERFLAAAERDEWASTIAEFAVLDLDACGWLSAVRDLDAVLWTPTCLGTVAVSYFKEKVYFMERHLGIRVMPNFSTVWHFESKVAQRSLMQHYDIPTPATFSSTSMDDSLKALAAAKFPLVFKKPAGAGSRGVSLVRSRGSAERKIRSIFFQQMWQQCKDAHVLARPFLLSAGATTWLPRKIVQRLSAGETGGIALWQEFIDGNDADLRITVIGGRYAYAFWRRNRPGDFRASGSGLIDYDRIVPAQIIEYCIALNVRLGFDSMAYDLLFRDDQFLICEISYGYVDSAVQACPGHYRRDDEGGLVWHPGHVWPQELSVKWLIESLLSRGAAATEAEERSQ